MQSDKSEQNLHRRTLKKQLFNMAYLTTILFWVSLVSFVCNVYSNNQFSVFIRCSENVRGDNPTNLVTFSFSTMNIMFLRSLFGNLNYYVIPYAQVHFERYQSNYKFPVEVYFKAESTETRGVLTKCQEIHLLKPLANEPASNLEVINVVETCLKSQLCTSISGLNLDYERPREGAVDCKKYADNPNDYNFLTFVYNLADIDNIKTSGAVNIDESDVFIDCYKSCKNEPSKTVTKKVMISVQGDYSGRDFLGCRNVTLIDRSSNEPIACTPAYKAFSQCFKAEVCPLLYYRLKEP